MLGHKDSVRSIFVGLTLQILVRLTQGLTIDLESHFYMLDIHFSSPNNKNRDTSNYKQDHT